jgi:hypothetical protein
VTTDLTETQHLSVNFPIVVKTKCAGQDVDFCVDKMNYAMELPLCANVDIITIILK